MPEDFNSKRDENQNVNIGAFYSRIKTDSGKENTEVKSTEVKDPKYVDLAKKVYKKFPSFAKLNAHKRVKDAVLFLGWKLKPEEYDALVVTTFVFTFGVTLIISILLFAIAFVLYQQTSFTINPAYFLIFPLILGFSVSAYLCYYVMNYPLVKAEEEKRQALAYLPAMVGYLTMYLKLVPNLERAILFASQQGEGHLANEMKKLVWDTNLGVYNSISQGLDFLSYRWEKYSRDFKEAIMMIKSAMVEDNEARRTELLDKTTENLLDAIKLKMETYARGLSQPSLVLFYIGVLLPLLLVIILPIGSVFASLPFSNPWVLSIIYCVAIPLFVFFYGKKISRKVPLLYKAPIIPDDYKGLPKKNHIRIKNFEINLFVLLGLIFVIGLGILYIAQISFGVTLEKIMRDVDQLPQKYIDDPESYFDMLTENYILTANLSVVKGSPEYEKIYNTQKMLYSLSPGHDTTPYIFLYGFAVLLAILVALYAYLSSKDKKKIQDYYMGMEKNFREVLFILASRLSEGKPMETAIKETKEFFPELVISQDFLAKTLDNINLLGMPLEQALFDPMFGSLKNNPSELIKNNMKIISDSSELGVNTVAKTILSISLQLKNIEDIKITVQKLTDDVRQMMSTMASMIAPAVLGMVSGIQKVVILTLSNLGSSGLAQSSDTSVVSDAGMQGMDIGKIMGSLDPNAIGSIATPLQFNIILIINLTLVVLGLVYFISKVQSDSDLEFKKNVSYMIPVAIIVFVLTSAGSSLLLSGL
jgi:hypothetical protein